MTGPSLDRSRGGAAVPIVVTATALLSLFIYRTLVHVRPAIADAYHAKVRDAIESLPLATEGWLGRDVPVPVAAVKMLRPNAILSRNFTNLSTNERLTLLIVHVRDARDILGHYPPVCYPGQGWNVCSAEPIDWQHGFTTIHGTEYTLTRDRIEGGSRMIVDNFLVLPAGVTCRDMDQVEQAAQSPRRKVFGAAQFQLVHDGAVSDERRMELVEEFVRYADPALAAMQGGGEGQ